MLSRTLYQCLISCDPSRLDAIAERWGIEQLPARRREAAAVLAEEMLLPQSLNRVWAALTADERDAIAALQTEDGSIPWPTFTRRWGDVRSMGPGRIARERPWESPTSPAEGLWYWGLVYRIPAEGPTGLYEAASIPDELRMLLPEPTQPTLPQIDSTEAPPFVVEQAADHLLDDGCSLLAYIQNHRVRLKAEGAWPAPHEEGLSRRLRDPDPARLAFLHHLAHRLNWLRDDDQRLRPDPDEALSWLRATAPEQRLTLFTAWREDDTWNDLWHVPSLHPDDTGSWYNDPTLAREAVLRILGACELEKWYTIDTFIAAIKSNAPDFQRPDGDYESWYIRDAASGEHLSGFESWDAVEGALIRYLITHPLAWLGVVDLGGLEEGGPATAFRLPAAGAAIVGLLSAEEEAEPDPLVLHTDLTVEVTAARRYDRFQLSRVADWISTGDRYTYRLSAGSLARAREQGIAVQRVSTFLEENTGQPIPPPLKTALGRWARAGTEVRLERAILLRTKGAAMLEQLTTSSATRHLIGEVLGPKAALVDPEDWPHLAQALVKEGLIPDIDI